MFFQKKLLTDRLILRKWYRSDSLALYHLAKIPEIGIQSGWRPHTSVFYSKTIIENTYFNKYHFAVVLKDSKELIGNISLLPYNSQFTALNMNKNEAELGFWIGKPYWGNGYATEASLKIIEYGFNHCHFNRIWCGSLENNISSKRVQKKCGFVYKYSVSKTFQPELDKTKKEDVYYLDKSKWLKLLKKPSNY